MRDRSVERMFMVIAMLLFLAIGAAMFGVPVWAEALGGGVVCLGAALWAALG